MSYIEPNETELAFMKALDEVCMKYQRHVEPERYLGCVMNCLAKTVHCITSDDQEEIAFLTEQIADMLPGAVMYIHEHGKHTPYQEHLN